MPHTSRRRTGLSRQKQQPEVRNPVDLCRLRSQPSCVAENGDHIFDVAIIGGGPAGSTAAALLALAGRRVEVLEKDRFPRFLIGESLLPRGMEIFERTGVLPKIEAAGFVRKFGAEIVSGCGTRESRFYFKDGFRPRGDSAFQVRRAEFDKILLDHARECGAGVREETAVAGIHFSDDGVVLDLSGSEGPSQLRARYVLDCSGRASCLANKFGLRRGYPDLKKLAVYAHYENVGRPEGIDGTLTRMVRAKHRWIWMIPLSATRMSVGVVMDSAVFRSLRKPAGDVLESSIRMLPPVAVPMKAAERCTPVFSTGEYSYRHTRLHGPRWLMAGDSAGFIDPVFSSGVFLAILGAEHAADTLNVVLDHPGRARGLFPRHAARMNKIMALYLRFVRAWYRQEFIETVLSPQAPFEIVPAVNAVLAGNISSSFALHWRLAVFRLIVFVQRFVPLCPRLSLEPASSRPGNPA